ncbi:syntaxin-7-like [Tubulanus polymorphus]|uniref:syntaxin-7-like n=1 Tax=Tubulanus polymorphus TaxID=672921 RepID=UPI003DA226FE
MSSSRGGAGGYGTVKEYRDDPSIVYRDDPGSNRAAAAAAAGGYQHQSRIGNYERLHDQLSSNIFQINTNTTSLERLLSQIGSKNDTPQHREKLHEQQQRTNRIIAETLSTLKASQKIPGATSQQKMNLTRLNSQFRETVERYNRIQKNVAERIRSCKPLVKKQSESGQLIAIDSPVGWNDEDNDRQNFFEQEEKRQAQIQAENDQIAMDVELAQEREQQIKQLEGDILDINEVFKDLANLVYEQGDTIESIEANVTRAADDVHEGGKQLHQASEYQKKYRKKLCIFVAIVAIIAAIVITIVVVEVKKKK